MEYVLDITTDVFENIKEHRTLHLTVPAVIEGNEIHKYDTLKLYHPGEEVEAFRIEIVDIMEKSICEEAEQGQMSVDTDEKNVVVEFQLLEWMFQMETELDDLLREEKKWEGLL